MARFHHQLASEPITVSIAHIRRFILFLATAATLLLAHRLNQQQAQPPPPQGRLAAQQVLDLSAPICRALAPEADPQTLEATPVYELEGHFWSVTSHDQSGRELARICWNADTAEPFIVTGQPPQEAAALSPPRLSREAGVLRSRQWIEALRLAAPRANWHQNRVAEGRDLVWIVHWQCQDLRASIEIDAHSGALVNARIWHTRQD